MPSDPPSEREQKKVMQKKTKIKPPYTIKKNLFGAFMPTWGMVKQASN